MIRGDIEARNLDRIDVGLSVSRSARVETNMDAMHDRVHEEHLITLVALHNPDPDTVLLDWSRPGQIALGCLSLLADMGAVGRH